MVRRAKFADGTPKPLPKPERSFADKLKTLKSVSQGISPESRIRLLDYFIQEALTKGQLNEEQASGIYDKLREDKDKIRDQIEAFERENFVEGGLLKTGPNTGKYVLRSKIDGETVRRYFDTKKEFDEAVKISKANKGGGARDMSERISKPTNSEIEISEKVYGDKYNKKGEELWKSLTVKERGGIRQGTTTGGKKGPTEGLAVNQEGKPNYVVKREKALKRNAPFFQKGTKNFQFHHIMNIGGEIPLDTNDIGIISEKMNRTLAPYNRKLNNIADNISDLINAQSDGYLKKIETLNNQAEGIVKNATKQLPNEYKNLIGFNKVVPVFDENATVIDFTAKKVGGSNQKQPGIKLENLTNKQASALRKQIKADALKFEKAGLKDKILSGAGKVLKTAGKVIKPVGYAVGTKALFDARALAKEQGIELSKTDQLMALDSGDPNVAINNYMRRNDPEFAAQERAKDLGQMTDDFEEVGQSTFGKYNDQIKNIKLP